jgi:hypothetical protein
VRNDSGPSHGPRVILAPLNLGVALPPDLDDAVPIVEQALIADLQRRGARVAVIWPPDATALWQECVAGIDSTGDPARDLRAAARSFAEILGEKEPYAVLLLPSLVLREARVSGRSAQWDGVRRRIGVRVQSQDDASQPAPDSPVFDASGLAAAAEWRGRTMGLSLHLLAWRPGRRTPSERWAGLDLVHDAVQMRRGRGAPATLELRPRAQLLADPALVQEGVALAVDPIWERVR